ncbi:hypothetical protein CRV15_35425 (plasmid) [Streptomyces clavuligerus]|uniref:Uncharacterized protein n=1 Tax=Streptomyces clavuligerus TaxID=1901 RepID=B5GLY0_STRCL|nr:hypothetical protein SSCG_00354 [Streptomyces clavuligerus]EFG04985.1 Hypothetical protein SCLAV_p1503 [Streptomyces clavuligerus]QCS10804.1 hypothetical protein CRV15_35425 [Streptomyces clavuligerus]QPJ97161.1 hypothetical protein GE265_29060 [Streptomyces clavuligerus]
MRPTTGQSSDPLALPNAFAHTVGPTLREFSWGCEYISYCRLLAQVEMERWPTTSERTAATRRSGLGAQ